MPLEVTREQLIETTAWMVRIPSVNPSLVPGAGGESDLARAIAARLQARAGIDVELQDSGDGRLNVIAATGNGRGRTLMLNGHLDTVGVAGMADPYSGALVDGRIHGRGSADMKGACAGALLLLEAAARSDFPGRLIVTLVTDEEHSSIGTQSVCREIARWQPDAALVVEGTDLDVTVAHKGFAWATIRTQGFAAHGSDWHSGVDAIAGMGRVIVALEAHGRELLAREPHPIVGPPSLHCSLVRGGQELSSYPDWCELEIERRTIPGETAESVRVELQAILDRLAAQDDAFRATLAMGLFRQPFAIAQDAEIVQVVSGAIRDELGREPALTGAAGWMDSALLDAVGVPTAIFGPGGDGAHGMLEWIDLDSLEAYTRVLARVAEEFCASGT